MPGEKMKKIGLEDGTVLTVEDPGASVTKDLMDALKKSGMRESYCENPACGRFFLTRREREDPELCPPCAGLAPPDKPRIMS